MRTKITLLTLALMLSVFPACAPKVKQTPQYAAATTVNSFAVGLKAFEDGEIVASHDGVVPAGTHRSIQSGIKRAWQYEQRANDAAKNGNLSASASYYHAAFVVLQDLDPQLVGVKNPARQQELKTLLSVVTAIAQQFGGGAQ